jgi:hypothetical protein
MPCKRNLSGDRSVRFGPVVGRVDTGCVLDVDVGRFVLATNDQVTVVGLDVDVVGEAALGVGMLGVVEFLGRRWRLGDAGCRAEVAEWVVDGDIVALEEVPVALVVVLDLVGGVLHHLRPAVVVEVEIGLDVGDLASLGLRVAKVQRRHVRVHRRVEEVIEMGAALRLSPLVGTVEKDPGVEVDQPVVGLLADDRHRQRLLGGPVTDVLPNFHLDIPMDARP